MEPLSSLVFADRATRDNTAPECANVGNHVARTSSMETLAGDTYHRHWRLRGNTLNFSPDIAVEHQVADDKDANLRKAFQGS